MKSKWLNIPASHVQAMCAVLGATAPDSPEQFEELPQCTDHLADPADSCRLASWALC